MFGGFWTTAVIAPLILGVLASPLFYQARRLGRDDTIRRFIIGGAVITLIVASLAAVSDKNVQQCFDVGNSSCLDAGTTGMQIMFMGGYVLTSWWVARVLSEQ